MPGANFGGGFGGGGGGMLGRLDQEKRQGAKVGLGVAAAICLLFGVGAFVFSGQAQELRRQAAGAMIRTPENAVDTDGLVCIEAVVPEIAQPYRIPGTEIDCLYVEEEIKRRTRRSRSSSSSSTRSKYKTKTTTHEHAIPGFQLGPIAVKTAGADYRGTTELHSTHEKLGRDETTVTWTGIAAGTPVTVLGHAQGGQLGGPAPFLISTHASHQALLENLQSSATMLKVVGVLMILLGLAAAGGAVFAFRG